MKTPEPLAKPAIVGAVLLHGGIVAVIVLYGFFHPNQWGDAGPGGAIQVNISSIPLPPDHPPNENVLATEKPSEASAPPEPKAKQAEDETAIPIQGKPKKPEQKEAPKTPPKQKPVPQNRAQFGEQVAANLPRTATPSFSNGPASVDRSSFGSINQWYVDQLNRVMSASWYKPDGLPIPHGSRANIVFRISQDGTVSEQQLLRSSGNSVLDDSCLRASQRVDRFPPLPSDYRFPYVMIDYYCEY